MIFQYGSQKFALGTVEPRISSRANVDARQVPWSHNVRWDLTIWLLNPTNDPTALDEMIKRCQEVFSQDDQDIRLLTPDGKPSAHQLLSSQTFGGIGVVQPPTFENSRGAENVTYRTTQVALEGTVLVDSGTGLIEHFEEITFQGGGPRFGHLEPLFGFPVKQLLKQNTIYRATQTGRRAGIFGFPNIALPIWDEALIDAPIIAKSGPHMIGTAYTNFLISWTYQFESASPLFGDPTPWLF